MTSFVSGVISLPTHFGTSCIHGIRNSVNWCRMLFITYSCQITRELESTICIKFDPLLIWVVWWQPHHGVDDPFWGEPDLFLGHFHQIALSKTKTTTKNGIIWWENGHPLLICSLPSTSQTILRHVDQWNTTKRALFSFSFPAEPNVKSPWLCHAHALLPSKVNTLWGQAKTWETLVQITWKFSLPTLLKGKMIS